jgi:hypothetical protein
MLEWVARTKPRPRTVDKKNARNDGAGERDIIRNQEKLDIKRYLMFMMVFPNCDAQVEG